ncbi:BURP domain-containing protein 12-like [Phoenix dactylifera]|uniref:BURP domain-containing protein 12-like n=1 Tax=Phoenix dactylifera TaxID=42345 RepID=A0A8B9AI90_PHODC|nr:BURP domain-containing protein 12-like [Phoenix dactylifera]
MASLLLPVLLLSLLSSSSSTLPPPSSSPSPLTAKAAALRYWHRKNPHHRPLPPFLLSKLSPLSPLSSAALFSAISSATTPLPSFLCSAAHLLCSSSHSPPSPSDFSNYNHANFSSYGDSLSGGRDAFKSYSSDANTAADSFRRYSLRSSSRPDSFSSYSSDANIAGASFSSYAAASSAASGSFSSYAATANVPDLRFSSYDPAAVHRPRTFSSYSPESNSGGQSFSSYGRRATGSPATFSAYAADANVLGSGFAGYGEAATAANDTFSSYGSLSNKPSNTFRTYGDGGSSGVESFAAYRERANTGTDTFRSYAKHGTAARAEFLNYGASFNPGSDSFNGYGEGAVDPVIGFRVYAGENTTFKAYTKSGITFAAYRNKSSNPVPPHASGKYVYKRWVEPGKFFRESSLQNGTAMRMPDIRDKMLKRSFLPRPIAEKLPFSAMALAPLFGVSMGSTMGRAMAETVAECERAPSRGETKRCVASMEGMIDFATSMLGNGNVVVRSAENARGSGGRISLGNVRGINGGKVTRSVSCHQSSFPYLVYYCHSVPQVRAYEADILDAESGERINHGVAICHLDTSDWSPGHGAFVALGSGPGQIEVCHWIFEGDMTWTVAD